MTNAPVSRLAPLALAAVAALPAAVAAPTGQPETETLEWIGDYQQALALAKETGRPLLVEFRCGP